MIRSARLEDVEAIYQLGEQLHLNYRTTNCLEKMLKTPYYHIYVDVEDEHIVAFLLYSHLYETVELIDLFVDANYRRKHIATRMMNYMLGNLDSSVKRVLLEVAVDNDHALQLYRNFDFQLVYRRKEYYGDVDGYLMERSCNNEK